MFRLEKKQFRGELSHLPVPTGRSITSMVRGGIMRDNGYKLKQEKVHLDIKEKLRTVRHWNGFSRVAVCSPYLKVFKTRLAKALSRLI